MINKAWPISVGCLGGAAAYYLYRLNYAISNVKSGSVTLVKNAPALSLESKTLRSVVNPRGHDGLRDTLSIIVDLPSSKVKWTDEQILANFVRGFFGGWAFTPERLILQAVRLNLVSFSSVPKADEQHRIWSVQRLVDGGLPPVTSTLFGAFQVVGLHMRLPSDSFGTSTSAESYVDFGFGSDEGSFAGVHRFSIQRLLPAEESRGPSSTDAIKITVSHLACNPIKNKPIPGGLLVTFHHIYAMLLFREGVSRILDPNCGTAPGM